MPGQIALVDTVHPQQQVVLPRIGLVVREEFVLDVARGAEEERAADVDHAELVQHGASSRSTKWRKVGSGTTV